MQNLPRYVFIGHGWDLNKELILKDGQYVAMLSTPTCLFEEPTFRHMRLLATTPDPEKYTQALLSHAKEYNNDFCLYSSEEKRIPELLLTTYSKSTELSKLVKVGEMRGMDVPNVFLLSEILAMLQGKNPSGFFLIVYACRSPLTEFQVENIGIFGEAQGKNILDYINQKSIHVSSEEEAENKLSFPCKRL